MKKIQDVQKVVERWDPFSDQLWLRGFNEKIINEILPYIKNKNIIDAGCGCGLFEKMATAKMPRMIDAYDISKSALDTARKYLADDYQTNKVNFDQKNFNLSGFKKNKYHLAVSIEVIEHLTKYKFYLKNLYDSLVKGGMLFISTPNKDRSPGLNHYHVKEFTYDQMNNLLNETGFKVKNAIGIERNDASKFTEYHVSQPIINLVKKLPVYGLLIRLFFNFKKVTPQDASTILYIAVK